MASDAQFLTDYFRVSHYRRPPHAEFCMNAAFGPLLGGERHLQCWFTPANLRVGGTSKGGRSGAESSQPTVRTFPARVA